MAASAHGIRTLHSTIQQAQTTLSDSPARDYRDSSSREQAHYPSSPHNSSPLDPPAGQSHQPKAHHRLPSSPLLHTRFGDPPITQSSGHSQTFGRNSGDQEIEVDDEASLYSVDTSPVHDYHSYVLRTGSDYLSQTLSPSTSILSNYIDDGYRDSWQTNSTTRPESNLEPFAFRQYESSRLPLPKVVISSPPDATLQAVDALVDADAPFPAIAPITSPDYRMQGRVPSVVPKNLNFSRPSLPPIVPSSDEHKRRVLERNAYRVMSPGSSPSPSPTPHPTSVQRSTSAVNPVTIQTQTHRSASFSAKPTNDASRIASLSVAAPLRSVELLSRSPSQSHARPQVYPFPSSSKLYVSTTPSPSLPVSPRNAVPLPTGLPSPPHSSKPESIYSAYSFYELDSRSPSPSETTNMVNSGVGRDRSKPHSLHLLESSETSRAGSKSLASLPQQPQSPEEYLQLGIAHHEANRLQDSACCFEKSATENGGCAVGMLMWGLSLRHAWGCVKDEKNAFKWLKRAAEHTVVDLQGAKEGREVLKTELVLAVYEVGQCFFQGWGVPQDKAMGVSYFQTAAELGDPDAQQDLAFCLANGKGCKKDKKAAARWYRAAAAQGASTVGLAWIYKPKYTD